jgi:hypothetical protein
MAAVRPCKIWLTVAWEWRLASKQLNTETKFTAQLERIYILSTCTSLLLAEDLWKRIGRYILIKLAIYGDAKPCRDLNVHVHVSKSILKIIRCSTGSHCSSYKIGVICIYMFNETPIRLNNNNTLFKILVKKIYIYMMIVLLTTRETQSSK